MMYRPSRRKRSSTETRGIALCVTGERLCRADLTGREVDVGKRRLCLSAVQCAEGKQSARRIGHAPDPPSAPAEVASAASPAGAHLPGHLEELPRRGVLERRTEKLVRSARCSTLHQALSTDDNHVNPLSLLRPAIPRPD